MKKLKYILLFLILFLSPKVFALEYNLNNQTSATKNGTTNRYLATEIYNTGTTNTYTFGTRYSGKISSIDTYFNYPFEANTTYRLTYNMNTEDFRNTFGGTYWWDCTHTMNALNQQLGNFTYVSYKKVQFTFTPTENTTCIRVLLGSTNLSSVAITGISNWRLDSITLYDPDAQGGGGSGGGSTSDPNQSIINNNNENTQTIVNNNNENTQNIIENNNDNTKQITESIKDTFNNCSQIDTNISNADADPNLINKLITSDGSVVNSVAGQYSVSKYIEIFPDSYYSLTTTNSSPNSVYFCWYTASKVLLHCTKYNQQSEWYFHTGNDAKYIRFTLKQDDDSYTLHLLSDEVCINKLDNLNDSINQTNEYLMDDSNPNISDNEFTSLFDSVTINNPLSYLLQLPVQFVNAIVSQSNSCQIVNLGSLLGVPITLPCIDIGEILGSSVWNTIDILSSIGLVVLILKQIYESITNALTLGGYMDAKKGGLGYMSPLEFLCDVLTGFGGDNI